MHCGSVAGPARRAELTLEECLRIAEQIIDLKCSELTLIGGEVFLFRGWEKLARHLSDNGVTVNLITNGYKVGEREVDAINYAKLSNVGISLDGTEEIHNRIRNNKQSFSRIRKTMELLNASGIPIGVITSLLEINFPALQALYQFLVANDIRLWQIQLVNPMGNMVGHRELILDRKHIPGLIRFIKEKNKDREILVGAADNVGYYFRDYEPYIRGADSYIGYWDGCSAGISSLFIDSTGNVKGCGALYDERFIEGNVRKKTLAEIWHDPEAFSYNRKFKESMLSGACRGCDVGALCRGGCRASNYFMTGSLYENAFCPHRKKRVLNEVI